MTTTRTLPLAARRVAHNRPRLVRVSDNLRVEAAEVLRDLLEGASQKRIRGADVPGAGATYLSRAMNGCDSNPLYRLASLFLLMKRLGMGRQRALRLIEWLRDVVDTVWPEEEGELEAALEEDSRLDPEDDHLRFLAARGCDESARQLLTVKQRQAAATARLKRALRLRLAEIG